MTPPQLDLSYAPFTVKIRDLSLLYINDYLLKFLSLYFCLFGHSCSGCEIPVPLFNFSVGVLDKSEHTLVLVIYNEIYNEHFFKLA